MVALPPVNRSHVPAFKLVALNGSCSWDIGGKVVVVDVELEVDVVE
jgi:hypothetical protein